MSSARNENLKNNKTDSEINVGDESIGDTSSVYVEERYTEVVTRKFRGGKSWMVGCETFYTTKRTENPDSENCNGRHHESKWCQTNTDKEIAKSGSQNGVNMRTYSQDCNTADFQKKASDGVNTLRRPEVHGGARPDVLVMKWNESPVRLDEKNGDEETFEKPLVKGENSVEGQVNNRPLVDANKTSRSDDEHQNAILSSTDKKCSKSVKNCDRHREKSFVDSSRQRRRISADGRNVNSRRNVSLPRSGDMRRGVRFSNDRQSETGPEFVTTTEEEGDVLECENRRRNGTDRRRQFREHSKHKKPEEVDNSPREDQDGNYNINKKISVENWLKHSMRYKTHDRFKFDIAGIDFIEVNRFTCTDFERGSLPKRNISVRGGHSKFSNGCQHLYSNMSPSRDASFREGPSGRGHFARVFSDDNNEDFFLCASVFLFGHANLNSELRQVIELFSNRLHVRYPRDTVGPMTAEERQILSFASLFMTKVEALVRMSADEYYWKAFDPPGESRPTRTLHLYYYASNFCDLIVKRELADDLSWDCD